MTDVDVSASNTRTNLQTKKEETLKDRIINNIADASQLELDQEEIYEDSDYEIYFTKDSLFDYMSYVEDDNLFKIRLAQDDEETLK